MEKFYALHVMYCVIIAEIFHVLSIPENVLNVNNIVVMNISVNVISVKKKYVSNAR
jgi:hypothetical protein